MRERTREIAKAGIFGSKENPQIVTERDLKEIAETFPQINTAPIIFGHWANAELPRLGNVTSVTYDAASKSLTGVIEEEDTLADAVDAGYYPDVSIRSKQRASDGKMYLVHLAYLGQEAPAIKDLIKSVTEPLGITAGEASGEAEEGLREFPSPSEKQFYLSEFLPENFLSNDKNSEAVPKPDGSANQSKEVGTMTEAEIKKLQEENERLKKEAGEKDLALSEAAKQRRQSAREKLKAVMDEKGIPKTVQEKALSLSDSFEDGKTLELSDTEGKRNVSPSDCLIEIISAFTRPVEPGVLNLSDGDDTGTAGRAKVDFSKI